MFAQGPEDPSGEGYRKKKKKGSPGTESGHLHLAVCQPCRPPQHPPGPWAFLMQQTRPCSWTAEMSSVDPVTGITGRFRGTCRRLSVPQLWPGLVPRKRVGWGGEVWVIKNGVKGRKLGRRVL